MYRALTIVAKAAGVNLQMTIPLAKLVGKHHVFIAMGMEFSKRQDIFKTEREFGNGMVFSKRQPFSKAASFFQSGRVSSKCQSFLTKKLPSGVALLTDGKIYMTS